MDYVKTWVVAILTIAAMTSSVTYAQEGDGASDKKGAAASSSTVSPQDQKKASDYWTPERMHSAQPMDMNMPAPGTGVPFSEPNSGMATAHPPAR